jgi:hypothetical protein
MHLFLVQLLLMLLIHQASASLPSDASLPTSTADSVFISYPELEYLAICNICELPANLCRCLERVRMDSWGQFRQQTHASQPYYVDAMPIDNSVPVAVPVPDSESLEHRYSTIRPEDLVQHEPWSVDKSPNAPAMEVVTAAPIPMTVSAAAEPVRSLLLPEDIERLGEVGAIQQYPASIAQWSNTTYNPGDRLLPPEPALPPRRREPMQVGGFPCNHSSCSEVFDRKCDLRYAFFFPSLFFSFPFLFLPFFLLFSFPFFSRFLPFSFFLLFSFLLPLTLR